MKNKIFTALKQKDFQVELEVNKNDLASYTSRIYIRLYDLARDSLLSRQEFDSLNSRKDIKQEVIYCNVQYKQRIRERSLVIIKINAANISDTEFTLLFTILDKNDAKLISLGKQHVRFRHRQTKELLKLPDSLIKDILRPIEVDEGLLLFKYVDPYTNLKSRTAYFYYRLLRRLQFRYIKFSFVLWFKTISEKFKWP